MAGRRIFALCLAVVTLGASQLPRLKRALRRTLATVLRFALRPCAHDYSSRPGSVTLVLAPHRDDESLGCGGLIAGKRLAAQPVHVAFSTAGAASLLGHPTVSPADLAHRRTDEACSERPAAWATLWPAPLSITNIWEVTGISRSPTRNVRAMLVCSK